MKNSSHGGQKMWNKLHVFAFDESNSSIEPMCECGYEFKHPIHLRNGHEVCDIVMFPCICGSWHPNNYAELANEEFRRKIAQPGYKLSEIEAEIIKIMMR